MVLFCLPQLCGSELYIVGSDGSVDIVRWCDGKEVGKSLASSRASSVAKRLRFRLPFEVRGASGTWELNVSISSVAALSVRKSRRHRPVNATALFCEKHRLDRAEDYYRRYGFATSCRKFQHSHIYWGSVGPDSPSEDCLSDSSRFLAGMSHSRRILRYVLVRRPGARPVWSGKRIALMMLCSYD